MWIQSTNNVEIIYVEEYYQSIVYYQPTGSK